MRQLIENSGRLQEIWRALGGQALAIINVEDVASWIKQTQLSLPQQVENALHNRENLLGDELGGLHWWVFSPSTSGCHALLANAPLEGMQAGILQSWMKLIELLENESQIAEASLLELTIAWDRLHFLFQVSQIANRSTSLEEILDSIVGLLAEIVTVQEAFLFALSEGEYRTAVSAGQAREIDPRLIETILERNAIYSKSELGPDIDLLGITDTPIRDLAIVGFSGPANLIRGILGVINPAKQTFDASDIQLLNSVAEQVGAIVEAAWVQIRIRQQERLERELQIAAQIQASLLPRTFPKLEGIQISAYLKPAREMGGDFYDVAYASNGTPFLMLGDVSGKGIPASIVTALVHTAFHSEAFRWISPHELLRAMNKLIFKDLDRSEAFVTAIIVRIEAKPLRIEYASAGMGDLMLWQDRSASCRRLPPTGLPLGIDPELSLGCEQMHLSPGDILVCNSDGLTEATNQQNQAFGVHHLSDIINVTHLDSAELILKRILKGADLFCGPCEQLDDVAILLMKVEAEHGNGRTLPILLPVDRRAGKELQKIVDQLVSSEKFASQSIPKDISDQFVLALTEVFTNQVEHAYGGRNGLITGRITLHPGKFLADLYDRGRPPQERLEIPEMDVNAPPDRGYGLRLIQGLVDRCGFQHLEDGRNQWHLEKKF